MGQSRHAFKHIIRRIEDGNLDNLSNWSRDATYGYSLVVEMPNPSTNLRISRESANTDFYQVTQEYDTMLKAVVHEDPEVWDAAKDKLTALMNELDHDGRGLTSAQVGIILRNIREMHCNQHAARHKQETLSRVT